MKAPDKHSLKEAFENLTISYFTKKNDYEIMSYLGRITVLMVPYDMTENHLDYLVHYTRGFNWMDKAVEMEPDNINIRLNRAIESMKYPDILDREDCAKTDFQYLAGLIGNYPDMQKPVKKEVYSNLAELYEKEGDRVKSRIYKKRLNELE